MNLYSWTIPVAEWKAAWPLWPASAVVMAERFDEVVFTEQKDCPESDWDSGHLFTKDIHTAWRLLGGRVCVVIAAVTAPAFASAWGDPRQKPLKDLKRQGHDVLIWGVKSTDDDLYWIELCIPRVMQPQRLHPEGFAVPAYVDKETAARRILEVESYYNLDTREVVYHRFKGVRDIRCTPKGEDLVDFNT